MGSAAHTFANRFLRSLLAGSAILCIPCLLLADLTDHPVNGKRVLILNSYSPGYLWSDNIKVGIDQVLDSSAQPMTRHYEFMDSKLTEEVSHIDNLYRLYRFKYRSIPLDLIIVSDNNALNFILRFRDSLFQQVPVVFCGINDYSDSLIAGRAAVTGVVQAVDYQANIELALTIIPRLRHIVIITDSTQTGLAHEALIRAAYPLFRTRLVISTLSLGRMSMARITDSLRQLGDGDVVMPLSHFIDNERQSYTLAQSMRTFLRNCTVPMITVNAAWVSYGALGGKVESGRAQGATAAGLALRILEGTPADSLPVITQSPNQYMFDHGQLMRFGINPARLPPGSLILNRPDSFYTRYQALVWTVLSLLTILSLVVIFLVLFTIQRHRAQGQITAEKERLAVTLRSITDGVIACDTQGKITVINPVAQHLLGCEGRNCHCESIHDLLTAVTPHAGTTLSGHITRLMAQGTQFSPIQPWEVAGEDNTPRLVAISGAPIVDNQKAVIGMVLVLRDVTQAQKIEQALQNTARLESLGILAGGIAHDFNNLLGGMFGYIDIAHTCLAERQYDEAAGALAKLTSVYDRARSLTRQLLTFSRGGHPVKKLVSLAPVVQDTVQFALSGTPVAARFELAADLWPCEADVTQIQQVIDNMTINALHAMPEGGELWVTAHNVPASTVPPPPLTSGSYVRITLRDQGVGIAPQYLAKIFDPFFTTKQKGSGLGLATCFSIIKKHGGHIFAESAPGAGAQFTFYLPAAPGQIDSARPDPALRPSGSGRILIVDDEQFILDITLRNLGSHGYLPCAAGSDAEALDEITRAQTSGHPFICAILDLTMPGNKGGQQLVGDLRRISPSLKAIASSGYSDDPVMAHPEQFGFDGILKKPYTQDELLQALAAVVPERG